MCTESPREKKTSHSCFVRSNSGMFEIFSVSVSMFEVVPTNLVVVHFSENLSSTPIVDLAKPFGVVVL